MVKKKFTPFKYLALPPALLCLLLLIPYNLSFVQNKSLVNGTKKLIGFYGKSKLLESEYLYKRKLLMHS